MTTYSQTSYRGLLLPDEGVTSETISAVDSTYGEAGPRVGIPDPLAGADATLQASGSQSIGQTIRAASSGSHGRSTFLYKQTGATAWRGHNPPVTITDYTPILWTDGSAVPPLNVRSTESPHTLRIGREIWVVCHVTTGALSTHGIMLTRIAEDGTPTITSPLSGLSGLTMGLHPCLVELPSGRVLLYYYNEDTTNNLLQVAVKATDDSGSTWVDVTDGALSVDISTTSFDLNQWPARGLRVAYSNGQYLMMIGVRGSGTFSDYFLQYASASGDYFELVEDWGGDASGCRPNIISRAQGFSVFFIDEDDLYGIQQRDIGSAYTKVTEATAVELVTTNIPTNVISGTEFTDAELSVSLTDSGEGWIVVGTNHLLAQFEHLVCYYSPSGFMIDDTTPMGLIGDPSGSTFNVGDLFNSEAGGDYLRDLSICPNINGGIFMATTSVTTVSTTDASLYGLQLGGYSEFTTPNAGLGDNLAWRLAYNTTYLPIELPTNIPTWAAVGTGTENLTGGSLNIQSAGNFRYQVVNPIQGNMDEGVTLSFGAKWIANTPSNSTSIRLTVILRDASNNVRFVVSIRDVDIWVQDLNSLATLATYTIDTSTTGVDVSLTANGSGVSLWAKTRGSSVWSQVLNGTALTQAAGGGNGAISFGHVGTSTAQSSWYYMMWAVDDEAAGSPYATGFTSPDDLQGRRFGNDPAYTTDGLSIQHVAGQTIAGDEWQVDPRYDYPISALTAPSPARGWRSTDETLQTIVWNTGHLVRSPAIALYLDGINWRTGTLYGYSEDPLALGWQTLATLDSATGQTGITVRDRGGSYILNSAGATTGRYIERGELVGGTISVDDGSPPLVNAKITGNTQGLINSPSSHQTPIIDVDGSVATGTAAIWSPRLTAVRLGLEVAYSKFKLVIDASQGTPDGFYTIGQMVVGPLEILSQDYSWGRIQTSTPNTELTTYRDGSRSSRKLGDSRRSVSFGWLDGVDVTPIQGATPDPATVEVSATGPTVGARGDVPSLLTALSEELGGADTPLVYIPRIDHNVTTQIIQGRGPVYGRLMGEVTLDTLTGEEFASSGGEVITVANLTIEEEL